MKFIKFGRRAEDLLKVVDCIIVSLLVVSVCGLVYVLQRF